FYPILTRSDSFQHKLCMKTSNYWTLPCKENQKQIPLPGNLKGTFNGQSPQSCVWKQERF
ncbi:hypothetical protein ABH158_06000, partial [Bacteroides ovatus]